MLEISEIKQEEDKKEFNPFEYVTIPVKEYRALIKKVEKLKGKVEKAETDKIHYFQQKCDMQKCYEDAMKMVDELRKEIDDAR